MKLMGLNPGYLLKSFLLYLQFSQKTNEKNRLCYHGTSSRIVFIRFLGELKTLKRHFEINWPLKPNLASLTALLWACLCCWTTVPKTIKKILLRSPYLPSFSTKCSWETQVLGCTNLCFKRLIQNRQRRRRQIPISIPRLVFFFKLINGTFFSFKQCYKL